MEGGGKGGGSWKLIPRGTLIPLLNVHNKLDEDDCRFDIIDSFIALRSVYLVVVKNQIKTTQNKTNQSLRKNSL